VIPLKGIPIVVLEALRKLMGDRTDRETLVT
jgi:hypothetical protein